MSDDQGLRIVRLEAENVKRLRAVEIEPGDRSTVVVTGRNGQGKTSVLDSIWYALGGAGAQKSTPRPVRSGEAEASVEVDLGDFVVRRTWKADGKTAVTVTSKDGAQYKSPQKFLDERLGALSFDPLAFSSLPGKDQLKQLLELVELPFDPEELERKRTTIYEDRRDVNRSIKELEASLADRDRPEVVPDERSLTDLIREQQEAIRDQQQRGERARRAYVLGSDVSRARAELRRLEEEWAAAQSAVSQDAEQDWADPDEIAERIATAEEWNAEVREAQTAATAYGKLDELNAKADRMTDDLDGLEAKKALALAAATMPIAGLAFDAEGVTYRGIPFAQCSAAERLRVSLAMAMALNPTIRVIRITDGSLLDGENMELVREMAADRGYQVWLEVVGEPGNEVGFCIEDGEVVG